MRLFILLLAVITMALLPCCQVVAEKPLPGDHAASKPLNQLVFSMKGVGIDLLQSDFIEMKNAGIEILSTEWGMKEDPGKTRAFLDQAQAAGLKVVMDGGFSHTA